MYTIRVMATKDEFAALLRQQHEVGGGGGGRDGDGDWANANAWTTHQPKISPTRSRPPHAPKYYGEPPKPPSNLPPSPMSRRIESLPPSRAIDHVRSFSDFGLPPPPHSDPMHPFNKEVVPISSPTWGGPNRLKLPPRPSTPPRQAELSIPSGNTAREKYIHRRSMSAPRVMEGGASGSSSIGSRSGRTITKADLLKKLPNPRWGGAPPKPITYNRSRSGSDGPLLSIECRHDSNGGGYGATAPDYHNPSRRQSIESIEFTTNPSSRHQRNRSDASAISVTTDMAKSSLFKGVTDTGRIQFQLPKDGFRILMDSQLEAGCVYKRKLIDNEDELFVEFHTVDEEDPINAYGGCNRCRQKKRCLPPDLYVMAVDSTIYRRMLDEVIASGAMPCGTFFCGHHADVRQPDITIAAVVVGVVFLLLLAGSVIIKD